uniref:RNA-directed DNA polymerase n=1 Tax=Strongyloides venezuelensis TaxID=75913 RepID=A0A0K0FRL8_STRVS
MTKCGKIVILSLFYPKLIELLHTNHIGEKAIIYRLQRYFFVPHITPIIQKCLDSCISCKKYKAKKTPEKTSWSSCDKPFQRCHVDYGFSDDYSEWFLVVKDSYSNYLFTK